MLVPCGQIKLATRQLLGSCETLLCHIVSYRIVSYRILNTFTLHEPN